MRTGLLIPLLIGTLGGCALYFGDEEGPGEPGDPSDPGPEPNPSTPADPPTLSEQAQALLAEWSGCMSLPSFTTAAMAPTWSQLSTTNGGKCTACHTEGSPSFPVSSNAQVFFEEITENKWSMLMFFTVELGNRPRVLINTRPFQSVGSGTAPYEPHPRFTIDGAPLTALTKLYDLTVARKAAGQCDPPRLID